MAEVSINPFGEEIKRVPVTLPVITLPEADHSDRPAGLRYSRVFSEWARDNGFANMPKSIRSHALQLFEHADEISTWRARLPEKERRRLSGLQNLHRWRWAIQQATENESHGLSLAAARAAWRRFVSCARALPPEQGRLLCKP